MNRLLDIAQKRRDARKAPPDGWPAAFNLARFELLGSVALMSVLLVRGLWGVRLPYLEEAILILLVLLLIGSVLMTYGSYFASYTLAGKRKKMWPVDPPPPTPATE